MKNIAIITSGGSGTRIKSKTKKQFLEISGRPILFRTIDRFADHPDISQIIITLPKDEIEFYQAYIQKEYKDYPISILAGGEQRQDSVYIAITACPNDTDLVFIHDGVRPFVSQDDISSLVKKTLQKKAVIPVSKVKNTIKRIYQDEILETIPRDDLVNAFTPQVFQYSLIKQCHEKAKQDGLYCTDDASLLEHYGHSVYTLECSSHNFKITDKVDLQIAKLIIENNILGDNK